TLDGDVEDPTDDEGFQTDQRDLPNHRPRPRSSAVPNQASAPIESTQTERRHRTPEPDTSNKRQRRNPGQLVVPFQSTGDDVVDSYEVASAQTRQIHAMTIKPQRGRKPWTNAEVGALLRLIRDYGKSFSLIKRIDEEREDPQLEDRTPEDLRFKAREMKVKYLISKRPLPENLDQVPLGKKEIEKVNQYVVYKQEPQRSRARVPTVSPGPSAE
ncbi:hypothetical protein KCU97_g15441, partial [Aureobasidium melanogenum]